MRKKKSEVDVTKQTLAQEVAATPAPATTDGVIDLDPETTPTLNTEYRVENHVGETVVLQPEQHAVKTKRKYTKRAKGNGPIVPTFVDRDAIRSARIQTFIAYVDGKVEFADAVSRNQSLKDLDTLAAKLS